MTTTLEDRLRSALTARAGQITAAGLQPATPPSRLAPAEPGLHKRLFVRWKPILAGAAVAGFVAVVVAWNPLAGPPANNSPQAPPVSPTPAPTRSRPPVPTPSGTSMPRPSDPAPANSPPTAGNPAPQPATSTPPRNPGTRPTSAYRTGANVPTTVPFPTANNSPTGPVPPNVTPT